MHAGTNIRRVLAVVGLAPRKLLLQRLPKAGDKSSHRGDFVLAQA
jgi:hypothetical protein